MKGKRTLLNLTRSVAPELFPEQNTTTTATPYERKVELIIARYYFYISEKKFATTEVLLKQLEIEFCISSYQITQILVNNENKVAELRKQAPKKDWFKINWAHFVW